MAVASNTDDRARIILLGASNVTKGISVIIETAQAMLGKPLDVYCAIGHGRSYGTRSFVLVRSLPSIVDAPLWHVLDRLPHDVPTYALIADVGNDIMYGHLPHVIAGWVDQCIDLLQRLDSNIVMTSLPLQRMEQLSSRQYLVARTLLFPSNRLSFAEVRSRAGDLADRLESLAATHSIPLVELPRSWYGIDPIHLRASVKREAWRSILQHWRSGHTTATHRSLFRLLRLRTLSPQKWWLLGMQRGRPQPATTFADGTRVSLY